ncbi:hypothetical protein MYX07_01225 [Patescibacteria group bacterium AH-259-L07]|nr:hypothetical protein [Patescibacteria group bacterium AH-259-L07]
MKKRHQLLYALLVFVGLIGIWRGIWSLLDRYLFPTNPLLSSLLSIVGGIAILAITHYKLS